MPDLNAPDFEYGGGRPTAYLAADGTLWYATLEKDGGASGALKLIVYHVTVGGGLLGRWPDSGILGQGGLCLQGDGSLWAVGYVGYGDNQSIRAVPVPGFAPWAAQRGPQGPQGPRGDPGPQGPAGSGGGVLSARYTQAIERLCAFFGI